MLIYKKIIFCLSLLFIITYPILPQYENINSDLIIYLLILLFLPLLIFSKNEKIKVFLLFKNYKSNICIILLILFNILMYLSVLFSHNKHISFTHSIRFSMYLFIFYLFAYILELSSKDIKLTLNVFVFSNICVGVYSLYEFFTILYSGSHLDYTIRISSLLENSNNLGVYSVLSLFITITLFIYNKKKSLRILYAINFFLLFFNIITSSSRSALISLVLGILLIGALYSKKTLIFSSIIPVILILIPYSRNRIFQILDFSQNMSRIKIWKTAELMIQDYPLTGIGYNNFSLLYKDYAYSKPNELIILTDYIADHPHNIFIKIQTELGIIGSMLLILILISAFYYFISKFKSSSNDFSKLISASTLSILASFICFNLIDCYLNSPKIMLTLFIILGISLNLLNNKKNISL